MSGRWGDFGARLFPLAVLAPGTIVVVAVLGWIASLFMFTLFQPYDDEGYLLISLKGYLDAPLYDQVYTQYGPFYYVVFGSVAGVLGSDLVHDSGRILAIILWVLTTTGVGWTVWLTTRSLITTLGATILSFSLLSTLSNEPLHPGSLALMLLVAIVLGALIVDRRPRTGFFVMGLLCGALVMVKVNVGAFAIAAVGATLVSAVAASSRRQLLRVGVLVAVAAIPSVLMTSDLGAPWARTYAAVATLGIAGVVVTGWSHPPRVRASQIVWWIGGVAAGLAFSWLVPLLRGTSVRGLLEGSLLQGLGQAEAFTLPLVLPSWAVPVAVVGAVGSAVVSVLRGRRGTLPPRSSGFALIVVGLVSWIGIAAAFGIGGAQFVIGSATAWVALLGAGSGFARHLLPLLAVLQTLHAYPVAGSQVTWSALLLVPVGAVCLGDGITALGGSGTRTLSRRALAAFPVAGFTVWFVVFNLAPQVRTRADQSRKFPSLALPGAARLRLPEEQAIVYRSVASELRNRCPTFVSMPGMHSFHIFAQLEPITYLNATAWMQLFDDATQRRIVSRLEDAPETCILKNDGLVGFWNQGRPLPDGPLVGYIGSMYRTVWELAGYEIMTRIRS